MPRTRSYELDLLRLVAAVLVLLFHYTFRASEIRGYSPVSFPAAFTIVTRYGFLGVELFFLLSGVVILSSARNRTAGRFAVARTLRLYPAYWVMVTVTFLVVTTWGDPSRFPLDVGDWARNLTMLQGFADDPVYVDGVYWTLTRELVFYAIVALALAAGLRERLTLVFGAWLVVAAVGEVGGVWQGELRTYLATQYAAFFVAGAACAMVRSAPRRSSWALLAVATAFCVRQGYLHVADASESLPGLEPWVGAVACAAFVAVVAVVAAGGLRRIGRPWMMTAGLLTYPLYLVHQNVGYVLFALFGHDANRWVLLLGITAAVTAAAALCHVLVERPIRSLVRTA